MFDRDGEIPGLPIVSLVRWLEADADPVARVTAAFIVSVAGSDHPDWAKSQRILADAATGDTSDLVAFYQRGMSRIQQELATADASVRSRFSEADDELAVSATADATTEAIWKAFFPQAVGIRDHEREHISTLRHARTVAIAALAPDPITAPDREVLFTSNVLLTVPDDSTDVDALPYPTELRGAIRAAAREPQRYWFDHPIQIGVEPGANELLYGLRGLDVAIDAETDVGRVTCLLSVSVTHDGLAPIARQYVEAELARDGALRHLDVVVVTEADTTRLIDDVLVPALGEGGPIAADGLKHVVGVDGRYGRHYSFLKAVAALWHVAVDSAVRATFKIDLDQVFPQDVLLAQTGRTMFAHLSNPLWGASAQGVDGTTLELGMLAGALVNERDISEGLFTPDVAIPARLPSVDEHIFFSALPQGISTRAEMMERYDGAAIDGVHHALERVHVTGGTNGIRVDALRRHRTFTPSWIGRAEDQAYLLSALDGAGSRLAYAHAAGLIMRHDKEAFAGQAMAAAHVGKLIGDDVRILEFSAYVAALANEGVDSARVRTLLDPFTGCFVSDIPQTLVLLRVALRTLRLFGSGASDDAREYATDGAKRIEEAIGDDGDPAVVAGRRVEERAAWASYYDAVDALEAGAPALRSRAAEIMDACRVKPG
jgi:hypothetical protein